MIRQRTLRRAGVATVAAASGIILLTTGVLAAPAIASSSHSSPGHAASVSSPTITHTGKAPTGYTVTFRYRDPSATSVQIKGEWYFGNPYKLSALAGTSATDVVATPGILPAQWQPGDIPLPYPNSSAANWPVISMKKGHDGVWSYTTPLPSGVFNYGFFVDCTSATQSGCTEVADPSNPAWNVTKKGTVGSSETVSQVYVPSDSRFGTEDLSYQAPAKKHGTLTDVTYPAPLSVTPAGKNYLAVYTPPGYKAHGTTKYPTVYLNSGASNEIDWSTQGDIGNILDNLIDTGEIQPMVVVMPNTQGFPSDAEVSFDTTITDAIVPYVESHYNVSTDASRRAIGGLGYGASISNSILARDTAAFGYYGIMSAGLNADYKFPAASALTADQVAAMKKVGILVGGGLQDPSHYFHASQVTELTSLGVTTFPDYAPGGHNWYAWRTLAKDFLTRVAFFPPLG